MNMPPQQTIFNLCVDCNEENDHNKKGWVAWTEKSQE